jgi:hypothetical protein
MLVIAMAVGMAIGCAKDKKSAGSAAPVPPPAAGPIVPPPFQQDGGQPGQHWQWGASAAFEFVDPYTALEYSGRAMNNPKEVKINVRLEKRGNGFGGYLAVSYKDDGNVYREGVFVNGSSYFPNTSLVDAARYNVWATFPEGSGFHGFFQDTIGAVVLVVDQFFSEGDGQPPTTGGGKLYFKNFTAPPYYGSPYPYSPTHCWFISLGPNDCRAWKSGNGVNTLQSRYPDQGYKLLGSFQGLDLKKAFGSSIAVLTP